MGYAVCSFAVVFLAGLIFGSEDRIIIDLNELFALLCIYVQGCVFLCVWVLFLSVLLCDVKKALISVVVLLVLSIELGWFFPKLNRFLLFTFPMVKRTDLIDRPYGNSIYISAAVMVLICTALFLIGLQISKGFIIRLQNNDFG